MIKYRGIRFMILDTTLLNLLLDLPSICSRRLEIDCLEIYLRSKVRHSYKEVCMTILRLNLKEH